jgi:hypothetical protein
MTNFDLPASTDLPSSKQLMKSTMIAMAAASALLVTVVLPAEYGIDPTGIGGVLGLTAMGEIKTQLAQEAAEDRGEVTAPTQTASTPSDQSAAGEWRDTMTVTLGPRLSTEIKLSMLEGQVASYAWSAQGGGLNYDLHADGPNEQFISYQQARDTLSDEGEFTAAFDGVHGWYWRNPTDAEVTITLQTRGEYSEIERLF